MAPITSRQHAIVKTFRRAARGDGPFALLDGSHLLSDALDAGVTIDTIAIAQGARDAEAERIIAKAHARRVAIVDVSTVVMDALSPVRTPSGIAALIERRSVPFAHLFRPAPALIVLANDMQDPGNVGAVIRAAEAGGATGVAFAGRSADPWSWKALRAAMGSTLRIPVADAVDAATFVSALREAGLKVLATMPRGGVTMREADLVAPVAIIMGGEGEGLSQELLNAADQRVTIPMRGRVESLNAAVAAALLVYEARRQRDLQEALQ